MHPNNYELTPGGAGMRRAASSWLILGLVSLVFAGVFSVLLVLARTPLVQGFIPFIDFFQVLERMKRYQLLAWSQVHQEVEIS